MCKWFRKNKTVSPTYIRNDEVEDHRNRVREAFGSIKKKVKDTQSKCMAMTNKGNRCKNNALEGEDYCYRHKALYG